MATSSPLTRSTRCKAPGAALLLAVRLAGWRRLLQIGLFANAMVLLGIYTAVAIQAKVFNAYQDYQLERRQHQAAAPRSEPLAEGELIGRLEIERLGVYAAVIEGTSDSVLRKALGHVGRTALPDDAGNMVIAGHRDTFFSTLGKVRRGDRIVLVTPGGRHEYVVEQTRITDPADVSALDEQTQPTLTLITCYPFHWIGPAPQRFIVQAVRPST